MLECLALASTLLPPCKFCNDKDGCVTDKAMLTVHRRFLPGSWRESSAIKREIWTRKEKKTKVNKRKGRPMPARTIERLYLKLGSQAQAWLQQQLQDLKTPVSDPHRHKMLAVSGICQYFSMDFIQCFKATDWTLTCRTTN